MLDRVSLALSDFIVISQQGSKESSKLQAIWFAVYAKFRVKVWFQCLLQAEPAKSPGFIVTLAQHLAGAR